MLVEEKAIEYQYSHNTEVEGSGYPLRKAFIAGYVEAKITSEVLECPFCQCKDIKWAFRLVKQCKNCNEYFNSKA